MNPPRGSRRAAGTPSEERPNTLPITAEGEGAQGPRAGAPAVEAFNGAADGIGVGHNWSMFPGLVDHGSLQACSTDLYIQSC